MYVSFISSSVAIFLHKHCSSLLQKRFKVSMSYPVLHCNIREILVCYFFYWFNSFPGFWTHRFPYTLFNDLIHFEPRLVLFLHHFLFNCSIYFYIFSLDSSSFFWRNSKDSCFLFVITYIILMLLHSQTISVLQNLYSIGYWIHP